jgi:hypothetical protein
MNSKPKEMQGKIDKYSKRNTWFTQGFPERMLNVYNRGIKIYIFQKSTSHVMKQGPHREATNISCLLIQFVALEA